MKSFARIQATLLSGLLVVLSSNGVRAGAHQAALSSTLHASRFRPKSKKQPMISEGGLFFPGRMAAKADELAGANGARIPGSSAAIPAAFAATPAAPSGIEDVAPPWAFSLMERTLSESEKDADMSSDFREAIARIEGMYDPTRLDGTGQAPRMSVSAGTASMNNVFADRWSLADTDANVDYNVRYIAEAWSPQGKRACGNFNKRRFAYGGPILNSLSLSDCVRMLVLESHRDNLLSRLVVVAAPLEVPAFAAPEPGSRLSSHDFWIAQEARIAMMKENLRLRRQSAPFQRASQ